MIAEWNEACRACGYTLVLEPEEKIRARYPDLMIITNSGIDIIEKTEPHIDAVLVEVTEGL